MKKLNKRPIVLILVLLLVAMLATAFYFIKLKKRNIQHECPYAETTAPLLIDEFIADPKAANNKYFKDKKDKVLVVTGAIKQLEKDQMGRTVVVLPSDLELFSLRATLISTTSEEILTIGQAVTIKGVLRSGAEYNPDIGISEDVIMDECKVLP